MQSRTEGFGLSNPCLCHRRLQELLPELLRFRGRLPWPGVWATPRATNNDDPGIYLVPS